ncbi:MAG: DUF5977 domain-containing protein [Ginsengibacter sp.]
MKKGLLLNFFFIPCLISLAQGLPSFEGNKPASSVFLQKVIPPSPTATSLGKYGDQQVNMFTGTSAINIPIYEIKTNGFSIPVSLAYYTSGLKVTEAASWVGLGWSLGGSGVVTRVIKGAPDGIQYPINIRSWPLPYIYAQPSDNAWQGIHTLLQNGILDPEPDIYIVKAGKLSIKFYYDIHKRIQTIPYNNDVKIKFDAVSDQYLITDDDGTRYFFGGSQSSETGTSGDYGAIAFTSSWYLSKIITPVGAQILYNNVKGTALVMQDQYSESEEVKPIGQVGDCAIPAPAGRTTKWGTQTFLPVFLNSIETDQEIVYLSRETTQRADMPGDYALSGIKVYSKSSGKYEYNFSFVYSYFPQVSAICWGNTAAPQHLHNQAAICKRLRLDQYIEKGYEGNASGFKIYKFQYSVKPVPARCSLDQDFWGYYNGAGNNSLLPRVTDPDFLGSAYNAVSRESNPNYSDAGMLQKIIYPTGGETDFTYEANEIKTNSSGTAFQTATSTLTGISPSSENSVVFTIASAQFITLNYTLADQNLPDPGLQRKAEIIDRNGIVLFVGLNNNSGGSGMRVPGNSMISSGLPAGTYTLKVSRNYLYNSFPSVNPVNLLATVTYAPSATVTVISRKIGGFRIKAVADKTDPTGVNINLKEFFYDSPLIVADIKNSDCVSNYHRWNVFSVSGVPNHSYECYFRSRSINSVQPIGTIQGSHIAYGKVTCSYGINGGNGKTEFFYSTDPDQGGFALTPYYRPITSYDHRRGNLLSQVDYNSAGVIQHVKTNSFDYTLKYPGLFSNAYYTRDEPVIGIAGPSQSPYKVIGFTDYALPSEWVRIKKTSETIYEGSGYISTTREFSYDNPNYSFVTQTKTTTSKGNVITEINKYPLDYKPATSPGNEEIERKFEIDYQSLFNSFVTCDKAAPGAGAINACYVNYQSGYDNLINSRTTALTNYPAAFTTLANATVDPALKAKYQLISKNRVSDLIETRITKDITTELGKTSNDFKDFSGNILIEKVNKSVSGNVLENELTVNSYDLYGNVLQATPKDGVIKSFIWDYGYKFPVAEVSNAATTNIAYTSFEADGKGNWTFTGVPVTDATAPTGRKAYNLNAGGITKSITGSITYTVSYWRPASSPALVIAGTQTGYPITGRTVSGWKYYEYKITGITNVSISGSGMIDELRLYPFNSFMSTSTYEPLKGLTSRCDPQSHIAYYDYDAFGRLILVRDQDRNILKKIYYNFTGQPDNSAVFANAQQQGSYIRNNCTGCQMGSYVTYTVQAGFYISSVSQADADNKAQAEVMANGQAYAISNGTCTPPVPVSLTGTNAISAKSIIVIFHNNCQGTNYTYTLNPVTSNVSLSPQPVAGNYNVSFTPSGGAGIYTYFVNGFSQHTTLGNIIGVDISTSSNQVRITP